MLFHLCCSFLEVYISEINQVLEVDMIAVSLVIQLSITRLYPPPSLPPSLPPSRLTLQSLRTMMTILICC